LGLRTDRGNLLGNIALRYPNGAAPLGHRQWRTCGPSRV
jgi:hypothetical protein